MMEHGTFHFLRLRNVHVVGVSEEEEQKQNNIYFFGATGFASAIIIFT
jgi:hypothetical protein